MGNQDDIESYLHTLGLTLADVKAQARGRRKFLEYAHGEKSQVKRKPLFTKAARRGMLKVPALIPAFAALNDADVSAFIRYIEKLKTHNTENAK